MNNQLKFQLRGLSAEDIDIEKLSNKDDDDIISVTSAGLVGKRSPIGRRKLSEKLLTEVHSKRSGKQPTFIEGAKNLIMDAIPATMGLLFIFINQTVNIIFIGKTSSHPEELAAIGLGTIYINATGYILGMGFLGGVDTLCSRSYGAKEYKIMSVYCNIAMLIMIIFFTIIPIPCIFFCETFLLAIGQQPLVAELSTLFCKSMIPSLVFGMLYNIYLRYLQAQDIFLPGMIVTLITAILHPLWCWIIIILCDFGINGAGFALGATQFLNYVMIVTYVYYVKPNKDEVSFFSSTTFNLFFVYEFLKYALPSAVLFAADWIGFDILTIMASYLSEIDLAANICLFNFMTLIFMIPMGISFAATTFVGNSIGRNNVDIARKYAAIAVILTVVFVGLLNVLVYIFRFAIPYFYTNDVKIAELSTSLLDIYVIFGVADSTQMIFHGIIKGLGKQKYASIACLIILYPINIPLAYYLAFEAGLGIYGLWYSQLTVVYLLTFTYITIVALIKWQEVADFVALEVEKEREQIEEDNSKPLDDKYE